jgi:iron complex outermembrane receptor protein
MRFLFAVVLICLSGIELSSADPAEGNARLSVNVPAEALESALQTYSKETGFHIVYISEDVHFRRSAGAVGRLTVDEALTRILSGTGLTYRFLDAHTISIMPAGSGGRSERGGRKEAATAADAFRPDRAAAIADGTEASGTSTVTQEDQSESVPTLEEVVVTAEKRAQRLIDVPESVTAISGAELRQASIHSVLDLSYSVPSLVVDDTGGGYERYFIRGVGNGNGAISLVGVYLDDADITNDSLAQLDINMTDLKRVEVLKGPQGTLYGEGSAGGTIRYVTNDPDLTAFSAYGDVSLYGTRLGSPSEVVSAVVNAPLLANTLGVRIVGTYGDIGGWVDQPAADRFNINNQNLRDVRVKALWHPSTALSVKAMVEAHRSSSNGAETGADANYNLTLAVYPTLATPFAANFNVYNLGISYDLPAVNLLSSTTYFDNTTHGVFGLVYPNAFPPTPLFQFINNPDSRNDSSFSQEIRATSRESSRFHWVTGAFFKHQVLGYTSDFEYSYGGPVLGSGSAIDNEGSKSVSIYGDGNYKLTSRVTVGAGVRDFRDDRTEYDGVLYRSGTFHSVDPRLYASYALSRHVNIYANAADGFRSGGFNGGYGLPESTFAPEKARSYEVGTKASLLDGRLGGDLALFFTRYGNYQIFVNTPNGIGELENGGTAHIKGVDWSMQWQATEHFSLAASGSLTNSRFVSIAPGEVTVDVGDPVDYTAEYMARLSGTYRFELTRGLPAVVRVDYSQIGPESLTDRGEGGPPILVESDVIHMLNARVGVRRDGWTLDLFATNLLGENGNEDPGSGFGTGARPRPRTVGIEISGTTE